MFIDVMIDCIAAQLSRVFSITLQGIPRRQDQMPVAETVELASSKPLHWTLKHLDIQGVDL